MKNILVGVDGSDSSKKAARWAVELARQTGAKLTLMPVLETPHVLPFGPLEAYAVTSTPTTPETLDKARAMLAALPHELPPGRVECVVEIGRPAEVLLDRATAMGSDQIILGARGLGMARRWLLGSVSDRVLHHAECPVTVVR